MTLKKKALKIPSVLATLGRPVKIIGEDVHYRFMVKDNVKLFATSSGQTLYCLTVKKKPTKYSDFLELWDKNQDQAENTLALYQNWHDFEAKTGSIMKPPKGFLFNVGRCESIIYSSDKWTGKQTKYVHDFKSKPIIWVNKKTSPTVLVLSGGKIRTTKRGIEG